MDAIANIDQQAIARLQQADTLEDLDKIRIEYLGKNGIVTQQLKNLGQLPDAERKVAGANLNEIKNRISEALEHKKQEIQHLILQHKLNSEKIDLTLPARPFTIGKIHPISQVIDEVTAIFGAMGFQVTTGPDIEEDFYNFTALNIPENHPARQMHDTFYLPNSPEGKTMLLRTHTSGVQVRTMLNGKPPFKIIAPGRTYRCDWDMTHTPMFHQVEGLYIDKNINMGHLKTCIIEFVRAFFEVDDLPVRFRASFFPFTEPSAEVDIGCVRGDKEIKIGAGKDWLEILGCGMVHPKVLSNVGVDPAEYQGFAFGMGVERLAMLKYGISDLRTFFESDVRWLKHYGFSPYFSPSLVTGLSQ